MGLVAGWNGRAASGRSSREGGGGGGGGGFALRLPPRRRGSPFRLPGPRRGAGPGGRREEPISRRGRGPAPLGWERRGPWRSFAGARGGSPAWAGPPLAGVGFRFWMSGEGVVRGDAVRRYRGREVDVLGAGWGSHLKTRFCASTSRSDSSVSVAVVMCIGRFSLMTSFSYIKKHLRLPEEKEGGGCLNTQEVKS